jgi:transcription antitermination protein NusB
MAARRRSRIRAVQVLYQADMRRQDVEESIEAFYSSLHTGENDNPDEDQEGRAQPDRFMERLVRSTTARIAELDQLIQKHSEHWRVERMSAVDRSILRLAVYEIVSDSVPPAVAIDEALEVARRFSGDDSVRFINGVLDAVRKDVQK